MINLFSHIGAIFKSIIVLLSIFFNLTFTLNTLANQHGKTPSLPCRVIINSLAGNTFTHN